MADGMTVKGLREAQRKMEQVVRDLRGNAFFGAMHKATLIVQAAAKRKAPVDTGRLRSSIWPEVRNAYGATLQGVVGSNVVYAPYHELGTKKMAAHPYLKPALDENAAKIADVLGKAVTEIVNK